MSRQLAVEQHPEPSLMTALNALARRLLSERGVGEVLDCAVKGIAELGFVCVIAKWERRGCLIEALELPSSARPHFDELLGGVGLIGLPLIFDGDERLLDRLETAPSALRIDPAKRLDFLRRVKPDLLERSFEAGGLGKLISSALFCPISSNTGMWGYLIVIGPSTGAREARAFEFFSVSLASALRAVELNERCEAQVREIEAIRAIAKSEPQSELKRLAPALLEPLAAATGSEICALYMLDPAGGTLTLQGLWGAHGNLSPRLRHMMLADSMLRTTVQASKGRAMVPPEEVAREGVVELANVPLRVQGQLVGVLFMGRRRAVPFGTGELQLAEALAEHVAIQLENAGLADRARRRLWQLSVLYELSQLGGELIDFLPKLEQVLEKLMLAVPADSATIHVFEEGTLKQAVSCGGEHREEGLEPYFVEKERELCARAARERRSLVAEFTGASLTPIGVGASIRYAAAIPLFSKDRLIGVLSGVRRFLGPISDEELKLLEACGAQVASAMVNARLYDDLKQSYEALEQAQRRLVENERMAALGELSAVLAHEVRNPLGVIFNSLIALRRVVAPTGDGAMLFDILDEEAERLNWIVSHLLDFARPTDPSLEPQPVAPVLEAVREETRQLAEENEVVVELELLSERPSAPIDARMVRQAVLNLTMNAIQAQPKGGRAVLRAGDSERRGERWCWIEVDDDGPGISPDLAGRIFMPFFTTRARGTGLGLSVVERIAKAHGGEVELMREHPGKGACLRLWLPTCAAPLRPMAP